MSKPHSTPPSKPPRRTAKLGNPFADQSDSPAGQNAVRDRRSLNPFISPNPFDDDDEVELHYVTTNPFVENGETRVANRLPPRPLPPTPPQPPRKASTATSAVTSEHPHQPRQQNHQQKQQRTPEPKTVPVARSPTSYFSRARRSGYNPFSLDDAPSHTTQLEDDEEEEALQAARTMQEQKEREREQRYSSDQRDKFRKSLRRLENRVDRSGENASVHCIDSNRENSVIRFFLSKRVFGYPGTTGTLFSNYKHFVMNNHPLFSMLLLHPKNIYSRKQRLIVYLNALFFALFVSFVLLGTTTVHQVSVCRLGCSLSEGNSTVLLGGEATFSSLFQSVEESSSVPSAHFALQSSTDNSTRCAGGYNDGMLYSSYQDQCRYYYPWLVPLVSGLFVTVYSSMLEFLATCSCVQGHRSCQVNIVGRSCKSAVETCGGTALALCTLVSTVLMVYAVLGSIVLQSDSDLLVNTLLSKLWALVEWFVYSLPYFCLKYPTDKRRFYEALQAKERRTSQVLQPASPA